MYFVLLKCVNVQRGLPAKLRLLTRRGANLSAAALITDSAVGKIAPIIPACFIAAGSKLVSGDGCFQVIANKPFKYVEVLADRLLSQSQNRLPLKNDIRFSGRFGRSSQRKG